MIRKHARIDIIWNKIYSVTARRRCDDHYLKTLGGLSHLGIPPQGKSITTSQLVHVEHKATVTKNITFIKEHVGTPIWAYSISVGCDLGGS